MRCLSSGAHDDVVGVEHLLECEVLHRRDQRHISIIRRYASEGEQPNTGIGGPRDDGAPDTSAGGRLRDEWRWRKVERGDPARVSRLDSGQQVASVNIPDFD